MAEQIDKCDPVEDKEFLAAVADVFRKFPDTIGRYALTTSAELVRPPTVPARGLDAGGDPVVMRAFDEEPPPGASHCYVFGRDPETGHQRCEVWWIESTIGDS